MGGFSAFFDQSQPSPWLPVELDSPGRIAPASLGKGERRQDEASGEADHDKWVGSTSHPPN
jgi:hypothetical protein